MTFSFDRPLAPDPYAALPPVPTFSLTSPDLTDGGAMPTAQVAAGADASPALVWAGAPTATASFLVSCFDPDAPTPAGFWHWTVVDVPATVTSLAAGAGAPDGSGLPDDAYHVRHDGSGWGYTGAAPPEGDRAHRYVFAVHALDVAHLKVTPESTPTAVAFQALFHTIARATLTVTHQA